MKKSVNARVVKLFVVKTLALAIGGLTAAYVEASPTGGVVVDGAGTIAQAGGETTINQASDRLSLQWDTFNVAAEERVQFVQPDASSIALNRILDAAGSQILGRIDANGQVILMNPNGILFGKSATVNVGGLVASGLDISSDDFMNSNLVFAGVEGKAGAVVNRGLIQAAAGGSVALLGKSVANHNLISADLGHIALAAGSTAVVTFDDAGLLGVQIDEATLASEVGATYAVNNAGTLQAKGGKILLNASVSADLFSEAVNHGGLNGNTEPVLHDDGTFTLGASNNVINAGTVDVSTDAAVGGDAGYIVVAGHNVEQRGTLRANASGENLAGQIYVESSNQTRMTASSRIEAVNTDTTSGKVSLHSNSILSNMGAAVSTSGDTLIMGYLTVRVPTLVANHLYLASIGNVRQVGGATVHGNTHIVVSTGADARLINPANDFNSFSLEAGHTSNTYLTDSNDLVLNNLAIQDSSLRITSLGEGATVSQNLGTHIDVDSSNLYITADNIVLGDEGTTTRTWQGIVGLNFSHSIATNNSIILDDDSGLGVNSVRIVGTSDLGTLVDLRGKTAVDLNAAADPGSFGFVIHNMVGANAILGGYSEITQTGPINLSGTLTWNSYNAVLDNPENDVASLQGTGGPAFGALTYVDKNDLTIRNLDTDTEVSVSITSAGEGATIRQAANTRLDADFVDLAADNIILGADGSSEIYGGYAIGLSFSNQLVINGPWSHSGWYAPSLIIKGDEGNNSLTFGEFAPNTSYLSEMGMGTVDIDLGAGDDTAVFHSEFVVPAAEFATYKFNMGEGNDQVSFNHSVTLPLTLGLGNDLLQVLDPLVQYNAVDFNSEEDQLIVTNP